MVRLKVSKGLGLGYVSRFQFLYGAIKRIGGDENK